MNVQFGKVFYIEALADREALPKNHGYYTQLQDAVVAKASEINKAEKLVIEGPLEFVGDNTLANVNQKGIPNGWAKRMVTGEDAAELLNRQFYVRVNPNASSKVNDPKILAGMRKFYKNPAMSWQAIQAELNLALQLYTNRHVSVKEPLEHIQLNVPYVPPRGQAAGAPVDYQA